MSLLFATMMAFGQAAPDELPVQLEEKLLRKQEDDFSRRIPFAEMQQLFDGPEADVERTKTSRTGSRRRPESIIPLPIDNVGDLADAIPQYALDIERNEAQGCYDADFEKVENCDCHASCKACGFGDNPTEAGECVQCRDGDELVSSWANDPRGHCVAASSTPTCVGEFEMLSYHWGEQSPDEYCQMGGAGYEVGSRCARAWNMYTNEPVSCTEPTSTPCCIPKTKICCIQPDVLVFPALPDWDMKKKVCDLDFRIRKVGKEGISKQACQDECYSETECNFYAVSDLGGCQLYTDCSEKRNTGERWTVYQKTLRVLIPTSLPTPEPTATPTKAPTRAPTRPPTRAPTDSPTLEPTRSPTKTPTDADHLPQTPPTGGDGDGNGTDGDDEFYTGLGVDTVHAQGEKLIVLAEDFNTEIVVQYSSEEPRYLRWNSQTGELAMSTESTR